MEWLNIRLTQLAAPEYLRSDPTERATWLQLLAHCAGQENGGIIRDCHDWKDRVWQQVCGITHREAHTQSRLWTWNQADLHVWGYPLDKERMVQQKRIIAATGGRQSAKARAPANAEAYASPNAPADAKADQNPLLQRKGKEGKGREEEKRESNASAPEQHELALQADAIATTYPRQDDPVGVRALILDELRRGATDPITMREAVQKCAAHIRRAPGGSANRYVPTARTFFGDSQWRSPEAFEERWQLPQPQEGKHRNGHREVSTIHTAATLKEL